MFAIGLLSLLSLGLVGMAMGDDGDTTEDDTSEDNVIFEDGQQITLGPLDIEYTPPEDVDPDKQARIEEFIENQRNTPGLKIEDAVEDLHAFLDQLEAEEAEAEEAAQEDGEAVDASEDGAEDESDEQVDDVARPPMGEDYRDPIIIADELEAQRILDEIAAEEARQPVNLVTVTDQTGAEVPDNTVLIEPTQSEGEEAVPFTVTAPDGENDISVGYDAEHTFQIEFNEGTETVEMGVNSSLQGPSGVLEATTTTGTDEDGDTFTQQTISETFTNSTAVTLNVLDSHIGTHIAQIELVNEADSLHLDFGEEVDGEMHLIYFESEDSTQADSSTTSRAFVIQTSAGGPPISEEEFFDLLATENGQMTGIHIIAEVYLGQESVTVNASGDGESAYQIMLNDQVNNAPKITSSISWTAVETFDDRADVPVTGDTPDGFAPISPDEGGALGDDGAPDGDDISDLFEDAGLNPGFFGF
ncbi:hypothetical protein Z946_915 [Sulfitobacter noctilucicola]|uniref:Calx-beta domain-containing protein n=1 Tax=Sulfitobacter noctilucicola TaxID=1342301 RepID=A0A7W6Q3C3_9RHOB|nr:hypothetical protein [Sulfitobacter noctilucicola]KIN62059.1 hypothetical protein Z946_915 [Sulfitobacter noctilucicola]MBB4173423.1 hypothetical protein [Sulfitobacter noctilucicola]